MSIAVAATVVNATTPTKNCSQIVSFSSALPLTFKIGCTSLDGATPKARLPLVGMRGVKTVCFGHALCANVHARVDDG